MSKLSNKNRLIVYLSLVLVVGFSLTSILSYQVSRSAIHDGIVRNQLPLVGDNVYSEIQRDMLRPVFISSVMAQDAFLRDWVLNGEQDERQVRRFLKEIGDRYKTVTSFFVSEKTNTYYHSSGILKSVDADNPRDVWYFRLRDKPTAFEINVDLDAANADEMTIFVNYKMADYDGNFIGITGVGLTVEAVANLLLRYQDRFHRRIYFVDPTGAVVLPTPASGKNAKNIKQMPGLTAYAGDILSQKSSTGRYQADGDTIFVATRFIPDLNWILVVEQSDAEAIGGLRNTLLINLAISLFVTIVVLALTLYAINAYSKALLSAAKVEKDINRKLTKLNNQKDKLLSIIGHDLRAPFTAFLGLAEILGGKAREMEPAEVSKYAQDVLKSGRNAYGLLDSLLNWVAVQWEDLKPQPEAIDLSQVVDINIAMFKAIAQRKKINMEWRGNPSVLVLADRNMTDLILRNLLNNAIKFTAEKGTVSVAVVIEETKAWVVVADTGIGLDPEQVAGLLDPTQKTSMTGTDGEIGIGMGLSLCREMVRVNGGELKVESELAKGSQFRFSLPRVDSG